MTIKLPEPTAFSIFDYEGSEALYLMDGNEELYKRYQQHDAKALDNLYTEAQLKQAIKDALEEAAMLCNQTPKLEAYSAGIAVQDHCANKIRKLKDQL